MIEIIETIAEVMSRSEDGTESAIFIHKAAAIFFFNGNHRTRSNSTQDSHTYIQTTLWRFFFRFHPQRAR